MAKILTTCKFKSSHDIDNTNSCASPEKFVRGCPNNFFNHQRISRTILPEAEVQLFQWSVPEFQEKPLVLFRNTRHQTTIKIDFKTRTDTNPPPPPPPPPPDMNDPKTSIKLCNSVTLYYNHEDSVQEQPNTGSSDGSASLLRSFKPDPPPLPVTSSLYPNQLIDKLYLKLHSL